MTSDLYIAIAVFLLSVAVMHTRYGILSISRINAVQILYVFHVGAQFIPSLIIHAEGTHFASDTYLFCTSLALFIIPIGGLVADLFLPSPITWRKTHHENVIVSASDSYRRFYKLLLIVSVVILFLYVLKAPSFPLLNLITNSDGGTYNLDRRDAINAGLIFGVWQRFTMPLLFILGIIGMRIAPRGQWRLFCWAGVIVAFLYNSWPGNKTPVATLFLTAALAFILLNAAHNRAVNGFTARKSRLTTYIFVLATALYPAIIFMFRPAGQQGYAYVAENIFTRIFFKPAENTYMAFELFTLRDYTYFADISRLAMIFGWNPINLSQEIALYRGLGAFTNAPPASIGAFFAQGGVLAVIFGTLAAALIFRTTENLIVRHDTNTPLTTGLHALVLFGAFRFSWASFDSLLTSELFFPMFCTVAAWSLFRSERVQSFKPVA